MHWLRGHIEEIPLPRDTVDAIISNCVINLSADKAQVLREAARVLKPGGRFAISDVIADPDIDDPIRADMAAFTGCIAGALTREEFTQALQDAGLTDISITETHRVHAAAGSAIVRATKPAASCCALNKQESCCEPAAKASCCGAPGLNRITFVQLLTAALPLEPDSACVPGGPELPGACLPLIESLEVVPALAGEGRGSGFIRALRERRTGCPYGSSGTSGFHSQ